MQFGKILKSKRQSNDLTQAELSELSTVNRASISQYEHGIKQPSLESLIALADTFDCTLDELLGRQKYIGKE